MKTATINNVLLAIFVFALFGYIGLSKTYELDGFLKIDNTYLVLLWVLAISILSFWNQQLERRANKIYRNINITLEKKKKVLIKNAAFVFGYTSFSMAFAFYYFGDRSFTLFSLIILLIISTVGVGVTIYKGRKVIKSAN